MRPQLTLRSCGLLVCALLLGLLGMHGLGPVPELAPSSGHDRPAATAHTGATEVVASMPGECEHGEGGGTGHATHADPTCASASVPGAPAVAPVLLPDVVAGAEPTDVRTSPWGSGPDGGRAPPSLSELQLLRI
nr:DUF6153 family protein [Streptomyces montanus]